MVYPLTANVYDLPAIDTGLGRSTLYHDIPARDHA
jgi:hypothetical protein